MNDAKWRPGETSIKLHMNPWIFSYVVFIDSGGFFNLPYLEKIFFIHNNCDVRFVGWCSLAYFSASTRQINVPFPLSFYIEHVYSVHLQYNPSLYLYSGTQQDIYNILALKHSNFNKLNIKEIDHLPQIVIFETLQPLIFKLLTSWLNRIHSLENQRFTTSGCKDIGIRNYNLSRSIFWLRPIIRVVDPPPPLVSKMCKKFFCYFKYFKNIFKHKLFFYFFYSVFCVIRLG